MYLKLPAIKIYDKLTSLRYIFLYQVWLFTRPKFSRKLIKELMFCIQYAFRPAFLRFVQNVRKANAGIFFLVYSVCMSFFSLNFPFHEIFFCTFWFLSSRGFGLRPKMCRQRKFPLHARKTSSTQGIGPLKIQRNTGLLIFNSLKQKKLIFNFFVHRNWKKLTDSRKSAKILADNRKSHHPIETLFHRFTSEETSVHQKLNWIHANSNYWQLSGNWESKDQTFITILFIKQTLKNLIFSLKPGREVKDRPARTPSVVFWLRRIQANARSGVTFLLLQACLPETYLFCRIWSEVF